MNVTRLLEPGFSVSWLRLSMNTARVSVAVAVQVIKTPVTSFLYHPPPPTPPLPHTPPLNPPPPPYFPVLSSPLTGVIAPELRRYLLISPSTPPTWLPQLLLPRRDTESLWESHLHLPGRGAGEHEPLSLPLHPSLLSFTRGRLLNSG